MQYQNQQFDLLALRQQATVMLLKQQTTQCSITRRIKPRVPACVTLQRLVSRPTLYVCNFRLCAAGGTVLRRCYKQPVLNPSTGSQAHFVLVSQEQFPCSLQVKLHIPLLSAWHVFAAAREVLAAQLCLPCDTDPAACQVTQNKVTCTALVHLGLAFTSSQVVRITRGIPCFHYNALTDPEVPVT
jgi:hypothetical protein